jgi:hypothetical protein
MKIVGIHGLTVTAGQWRTPFQFLSGLFSTLAIRRPGMLGCSFGTHFGI